MCHSRTPGDRERWVLFKEDGAEVLRSVLPIVNGPECQGCHGTAKKLNGMLILDISLAPIQAELRSEVGRMGIIYPQTRLHAIAVSEGVVAHEDDLLPPRFYISPAIGTDDLLTEVSEHAKRRPNWVMPALGIRSNPALLSALRRNGHRGPLWELL